MITTLQQAKSRLLQEGLCVDDASTGLLIGSGRKPIEGDIHFVVDPVALCQRDGGWLAVFPSEGQQTVEMAAPLDELVRLVIQAYRTRRNTGEGLSTMAQGWVSAV
ncbi:MAG: hypothetical protein K2W96_03580 [Gemmataceae bacterium]|nr:hypothetical protein [Gemmataceae bacterium]